MLRQFYNRRFHSPLTWGPVCVLLLGFCLGMGNTQGMRLFRTLASDISMLLFFFPLFMVYSLYSLNFFQKKEILTRFGSFSNAWRKCVWILLFDSVFFVFCFHVSLFFCYCLKKEALFYFQHVFFFLPLFLSQCLTGFAFALLLMLILSALQNSLLAFLITYLVPWLEKAVLVTHVDWNSFFLLAGMNLEPFSVSKWLTVLSEMAGLSIAMLILIPVYFSKRDYLNGKERQL